jgi:hypothetical protein
MRLKAAVSRLESAPRLLKAAFLTLAAIGRRSLGLSRIVLCGALVIAAGFHLHHFVNSADRAPYLAVDDSLANVSVALSKLGRYGDLSLPLQGSHASIRTHGFANYGPLPFLLGAGLDWLLGTSYLVQRSLHLLALFGVALFGFAAFRRTSLAAGGFFFALLFWIFWRAEWPMARPDPVVSLFAALGLVAMTWAIRTGSPGPWFVAGFGIATAVTTHLIAWALAPATVAVWALTMWLDRSEKGALSRADVLPSFIAAAVGGIAGLLVFLAAIEFRIGDLASFYRDYSAYLGGRRESAVSAYLMHFAYAWGAFAPAVIAMLIGGCIVGLVTLVLALRLPTDVRREIVALLLPPLALGGAYQLSLPLFKNHHLGYVILVHVTTCWIIAATIASVMAIFRARFPTRVSSGETGLRFAAAATVVIAAISPAYWLAASARSNVSISEYQHNVMAGIPRNAVVWGDSVFGLTAIGSRHLVEVNPALMLAHFWNAADRGRLAPDFVILNDTLKDLFFRAVARRARQLGYSDIQELFPDRRFYLESLTVAPPYGTARVYSRGTDRAHQNPSIAVYEVDSGAWKRSVGEPVPVVAKPTAPVEFDLKFYDRTQGKADRSLTFELPAGDYLVSVRVRDPAKNELGFITATNTATFAGEIVDLRFEVAPAPYVYYEERVIFVLRHGGGPVYVSQFDHNPRASFELAEVRPILSASIEGPREYRELPPPSAWKIVAENGSANSEGTLREDTIWHELPSATAWSIVPGMGKTVGVNGGAMIIGDSSQFGYQSMSPPLAVKKDAFLEIRLEVEAKDGNVAIGVLDENKQRWLAKTEDLKQPLRVGTENNGKIFLVVYNNNPASLDKPVRFWLGRGGYTYAKGSALITGDQSPFGYQLISPPVRVEPRTEMEVRLPVTPIKGRVAVGILDQGQTRWLAQVATPGGSLRFNTQNNERIFVVVSNNNREPVTEAVQFTVGQGQYWHPGRSYIDLLTSCREWEELHTPRPGYCHEDWRRVLELLKARRQ